MIGDLRPHVALLVPLQAGGAHQRGGQDQAELAPVVGVGLALVVEDAVAVRVEQRVGDVDPVRAAERVGLRLVDGLGPPSDGTVCGQVLQRLSHECSGLVLHTGSREVTHAP
jgi:hypothetical protein